MYYRALAFGSHHHNAATNSAAPQEPFITISTMSRNFNSSTMKIAFYDLDIDVERIPMEDGDMKKLKKAIQYAINRATNRGLGIKVSVVFDLSVQPTDEQCQELMTFLHEEGVTVNPFTEGDMIAGTTDEGYHIKIKFDGFSRFAAYVNLNQSTASEDNGESQFLPATDDFYRDANMNL